MYANILESPYLMILSGLHTLQQSPKKPTNSSDSYDETQDSYHGPSERLHINLLYALISNTAPAYGILIPPRIPRSSRRSSDGLLVMSQVIIKDVAVWLRWSKSWNGQAYQRGAQLADSPWCTKSWMVSLQFPPRSSSTAAPLAHVKTTTWLF